MVRKGVFWKFSIVLKVFIVLIFSFVVWFAVHTIIIVLDGMSDDFKNTDVAVVLGNKVELDGQPSERLQARLNKASSLYNDGYFEHIIVSGGVGIEGYDEAVIMKEYLIKLGVPEQFIILDSNGYTTFMTAENTKQIQEEMGFTSITVISQYHHITRTKLAFKKVGFEEVYSGYAEFYELRDVYSVVREFFAYYKYLLK
ncbi:YdcF family protein [Evansella sp. AB-rgal1]|uniref:YdcF family protein n=1 Tax=Evansella sp. AB-rgal1 TaxID=3242696 RepID=UPI00359E93BC